MVVCGSVLRCVKVFVFVADCEVSQAKGWNEDNDVVHSDDAAPQLQGLNFHHFFPPKE